MVLGRSIPRTPNTFEAQHSAAVVVELDAVESRGDVLVREGELPLLETTQDVFFAVVEMFGFVFDVVGEFFGDEGGVVWVVEVQGVEAVGDAFPFVFGVCEGGDPGLGVAIGGFGVVEGWVDDGWAGEGNVTFGASGSTLVHFCWGRIGRREDSGGFGVEKSGCGDGAGGFGVIVANVTDADHDVRSEGEG